MPLLLHATGLPHRRVTSEADYINGKFSVCVTLTASCRRAQSASFRTTHRVRGTTVSDEAAFLTALKANPADDTTRFVYADWLDEHGEPAKAEYLRLVTRLPLVGDDVDVSSAEATRANALGAALPRRLESSSNRSVRRCVARFQGQDSRHQTPPQLLSGRDCVCKGHRGVRG